MGTDVLLSLTLFLSLYTPNYIVLQLTIFGRTPKIFTDSHDVPDGAASSIVRGRHRCYRAAALGKDMNLLDSFFDIYCIW